jgi:hypothetical protein
MKVNKIIYFLCSILLFTSCKKAIEKQQTLETENQPIQLVLKKIADAKQYFVNNVDTNGSQKFKKSADWENASIGYKNSNEYIIVPLKYDKEYTFGSNFSGSNKFSLADQSHLVIAKDAAGKYNAEIITYYPDEEFVNNKPKVFSGLATVQDWSNNIIGTYKFKDGKQYLLSKGTTSTNTRTVCYYLNYYNCPPDYGGSFANCDYLGSELLGCGDETTIQCNGECGGNIDIGSDSLLVGRPKTLKVGTDFLNWVVNADFILRGYKFFSNFQSNYFTELPTDISVQFMKINYDYPNPIFQVPHKISNWKEVNKKINVYSKARLTFPHQNLIEIEKERDYESIHL